MPDPVSDATHPTKPPRPVFGGVFAFPPNRDTMGGTAYLITDRSQSGGDNLLVDCTAWSEFHQNFLKEKGGVRWLFLTHRGSLGRVRDIQETFDCQIVIQEQEAYLLPELTVTPFQQEFNFTPTCRAFWTPGYSPGSACLYDASEGGVLFSGRHILPDQYGEPMPLRISKTFHWKRQIQSIQRLLDNFSSETLQFICPGANTGFLRGQRSIDRAYEQLATLDLKAALQAKPGL